MNKKECLLYVLVCWIILLMLSPYDAQQSSLRRWCIQIKIVNCVYLCGFNGVLFGSRTAKQAFNCAQWILRHQSFFPPISLRPLWIHRMEFRVYILVSPKWVLYLRILKWFHCLFLLSYFFNFRSVHIRMGDNSSFFDEHFQCMAHDVRCSIVNSRASWYFNWMHNKPFQ